MTRIIRLVIAALLLCCSTLSIDAKDKVIKVLAIGNSFSEDAIEQNLYEIAAAGGKSIIIGNLYIGGCTLERHVTNIRGDLPKYRYRKILTNGEMLEKGSTPISYALADEDWDYISVQQVSHLSGMFDSYEPWLTELVTYVRANSKKNVKLLFHQTWAYAPTSSHSGFANYDRDQVKMYNAIMLASKKAAKTIKAHRLVPCGTAIQNARGTILGNDLTRDGFHMDKRLGRYILACTWYECIFNKSVVGNSFIPSDVTEEERELAQKSAHAAVKKKYNLSIVK